MLRSRRHRQALACPSRAELRPSQSHAMLRHPQVRGALFPATKGPPYLKDNDCWLRCRRTRHYVGCTYHAVVAAAEGTATSLHASVPSNEIFRMQPTSSWHAVQLPSRNSNSDHGRKDSARPSFVVV